MDRQQGGHRRVRPEVPGLARAVEVAAALGPSGVDAAPATRAKVRALPVHERQDRTIVQQDATVSVATGAFAGFTWKFYHPRRADSAAFGFEGWTATGALTIIRR